MGVRIRSQFDSPVLPDVRSAAMRALSLILVFVGLSSSGCKALLSHRVDDLKGYDLGKLDGNARDAFLKIVNTQPCPCGHVHFVGRCINNFPKHCPKSQLLAGYTYRKLQEDSDLSNAVLMVDRLFQQGGDKVALPMGDSPTLGPATAPVTLVEFSDFQCPHCQRAKRVLDKVVARYRGKLRLVYRFLPLPMIHHQAVQAAHAGWAAHLQGKFWPMHDLMHENRTKLDRASLLQYAKKVGLDIPRFQRDMDSKKTAARIKKDMAEAVRLKLRGTPSFYVNGRPMLGRKDRFVVYRDYIEVALAMDRLAKKTKSASPAPASGKPPSSGK